MDTEQDPIQKPSTESLEAGYERSGVSVKGLAVFLVSMVVFAAVLHVALWFLLEGYLKLDRSKDRPNSALTDSEFLEQYNQTHAQKLAVSSPPLPPPPRLQPTPGLDQQNVPQADLQLMYREEDAVFARMGWDIDPQSHVPRAIPNSVVSAVIGDENNRQPKPQATREDDHPRQDP